MEVTLALESLRASYQNIINPAEEVDKVITQASSNYKGFTLNTHEAVEATKVFTEAMDFSSLKTRELLQRIEPSTLGSFAEGFKNMAMTIGLAFAQMALQGDKSIREIINSLAKMVVQMGIAIVVGTVLKSLFDPTAAAVTASQFAVAGAVVAGAGLIALATSNSGGEVQGFAHGGIVTKPTMGIIGEAGQSEAVIPLNRLPQMMSTIGNRSRGEFTLRGQDLILALERAGDFRTRVTG
tara:strand:+ start:1962 stop:2678 length:717 start_codon:yes stop_codon:yes gene_type:complete